jgi:hypothetical protein
MSLYLRFIISDIFIVVSQRTSRFCLVELKCFWFIHMGEVSSLQILKQDVQARLVWQYPYNRKLIVFIARRNMVWKINI